MTDDTLRQPDGCTCIGNRWRTGDHAPYCPLAASATDEGPRPYVTPTLGSLSTRTGSGGVARPAVPALDAMTLGRAMDFVDREDEALGVVGRGRKVDRIIAAYAALQEQPE